jgi:divalent metal cation (Fe/Co/Zn/Cd) transporter
MLVIQFFGLWVLVAIHRERLTRFQFGLGKMEQFVWVLVGASLLMSGLWVASTVIDTVFSTNPPPSPLSLAWAAVVNAINTTLNGVSWYLMFALSGKDDTEVYRAQLRARLIMFLSSSFLQVTLTVAALAKDPSLALGLDALGATFVAVLMLVNGFSMIVYGLPDLLDAPASAEAGERIARTVAAALPGDALVSIRTRRSGRLTYAEIAVLGTAFASLAALSERLAGIKDTLHREGTDVDLALVVTPQGEAEVDSGA